MTVVHNVVRGELRVFKSYDGERGRKRARLNIEIHARLAVKGGKKVTIITNTDQVPWWKFNTKGLGIQVTDKNGFATHKEFGHLFLVDLSSPEDQKYCLRQCAHATDQYMIDLRDPEDRR